MSSSEEEIDFRLDVPGSEIIIYSLALFGITFVLLL